MNFNCLSIRIYRTRMERLLTRKTDNLIGRVVLPAAKLHDFAQFPAKHIAKGFKLLLVQNNLLTIKAN